MRGSRFLVMMLTFAAVRTSPPYHTDARVAVDRVDTSAAILAGIAGALVDACHGNEKKSNPEEIVRTYKELAYMHS